MGYFLQQQDTPASPKCTVLVTKSLFCKHGKVRLCINSPKNELHQVKKEADCVSCCSQSPGGDIPLMLYSDHIQLRLTATACFNPLYSVRCWKPCKVNHGSTPMDHVLKLRSAWFRIHSWQFSLTTTVVCHFFLLWKLSCWPRSRVLKCS